MRVPMNIATPRSSEWRTRFMWPIQRGVSHGRGFQFRSIFSPPLANKSLINEKKRSSMRRLPLKSLLRSLILTSLMSSKLLLKPSLSLLGAIAKSKSVLLDPDRNPILNQLLRWTVYNHFCAGTKLDEVQKSVSDIKALGFQGVILTHAKEILLENSGKRKSTREGYHQDCLTVIELWKIQSLNTLQMIQPGDILALKLTGAGPIAVDALRNGDPMPREVSAALDEICEATKKQGSRLWFDAEQQGLQHTVDDWAINTMRKWNRNGTVVVYNTIQAYLKASGANANRHITLAAREGWALGIKLVRGAYIEQDIRSLIHDTKEDTDRSYDAIASQFIEQSLPMAALDEGLPFPPVALMLATHNSASSSKACADHRARQKAGLPTCSMECAQVVGMADELSFELAHNYERCCAEHEHIGGEAPRAFKCLTWGSIGECFGYLHRRAIENQSAVQRTKHMATALRQELRDRIIG